MKHAEMFQKIVKKYNFDYPLPEYVKEKLFNAKKETLQSIIDAQGKKHFFDSLALKAYYLFEIFRIPLNFKQSRIVLKSAVSLLAFIVIGIFFYTNYFLIIKPGKAGSYYALNGSGNVKIINKSTAEDKFIIKKIIEPGDSVKTSSNSMAIFQFEDAMLFLIQPGTEVIIKDVKENMQSRLLLKSGMIISKADTSKRNIFSIIETPQVSVTVSGTEYSVSYDGIKSVVSILKGSVKIEKLDDGSTETVSNNKTAVIEKAVDFEKSGRLIITTRNSEGFELQLIRKISSIEIIPSIKNKSKTEIERILKVPSGDNNKKKLIGGKRTFKQIKEKYGRIDRITMYNGRIINGAIVSRGEKYIVETEIGRQVINSEQIRNVTKIK